MPPTHLQLMHHLRTCAPTNGIQQPEHSAPSLPRKKSASSKSQLHSKQSSNEPPPENFMVIGGCFKCYTHHVTVLGWLKKEERKKKMNNSDFRPFQVWHFKIVPTCCYYYCRLGQALYKLLYVLLDMSISSLAMISPCMLTLIH